MGEIEKIGIICDMHLSSDKESPQYAFLHKAVEKMKKDGIQTVICLGDITSYGEIEGWNAYCEALQDFTHYEVLGNSDVRDGATRDAMLALAGKVEFDIGSRRVIGIHTPYGEITQQDRALLETVKAGDIVFMHHYVQSLEEESRVWLTDLVERISITILHGHGHRWFDYYINETHVLGMRGLDPDKSIGNFPCINYLNVSEQTVDIEEHLIKIPVQIMDEASAFFGLSCVDNAKDIAYAIEHSVKYVELRCNGDWKPDLSLLPLIREWRTKTGGYLSVHMPNLYYREGEFAGEEQWMAAMDYALTMGADSLTMHPPRASLADMPKDGEVWRKFLTWYLLAARSVPATTRLGIENMHKSDREQLDEGRGFGYTPQEVTSWIEAINEQLGEERVGHVLDVGHARNNGALAQKYPVSRWYGIMGRKAVAYHIHQVVSGPNGLMKNHNAIEAWFGPAINYTSFFYAWDKQMINHVPVFLEVKGSENYEKSVRAFRSAVKACAAYGEAR